MVEGNYKSLYEVVIHRKKNIMIKNIIIDIQSWVDKFSEVIFSLISQRCNQAADMITKLSYRQNVVAKIYFYPRRCLRSVLFNDHINPF